MSSEKDIYTRLKEAFEAFKKEISLGILFAAAIVDFLPDGILPKEVENDLKTALIFGICLIMVGVLFEILHALKKNAIKVKILGQDQVKSEIYDLIAGEREVDIKYIGIAGKAGWAILKDFLSDSDVHSQLHKKKVNIEIALIDESVLAHLEDTKARYSSVTHEIEQIQQVTDRIKKKGYEHVNVSIYRYDHLPNMLGFLINDNYLYSTIGYWDTEEEDLLELRGGLRQHISYDKNDGFGGEFYIERFQGWFNYIRILSKRKKAA